MASCITPDGSNVKKDRFKSTSSDHMQPRTQFQLAKSNDKQTQQLIPPQQLSLKSSTCRQNLTANQVTSVVFNLRLRLIIVLKFLTRQNLDHNQGSYITSECSSQSHSRETHFRPVIFFHLLSLEFSPTANGLVFKICFCPLTLPEKTFEWNRICSKDRFLYLSNVTPYETLPPHNNK